MFNSKIYYSYKFMSIYIIKSRIKLRIYQIMNSINYIVYPTVEVFQFPGTALRFLFFY